MCGSSPIESAKKAVKEDGILKGGAKVYLRAVTAGQSSGLSEAAIDAKRKIDSGQEKAKAAADEAVRLQGESLDELRKQAEDAKNQAAEEKNLDASQKKRDSARRKQRNAAQSAKGRQSTLLTEGTASEAVTAVKSLLGQ